jgi:hypothetical protein
MAWPRIHAAFHRWQPTSTQLTRTILCCIVHGSGKLESTPPCPFAQRTSRQHVLTVVFGDDTMIKVGTSAEPSGCLIGEIEAQPASPGYGCGRSSVTSSSKMRFFGAGSCRQSLATMRCTDATMGEQGCSRTRTSVYAPSFDRPVGHPPGFR